MFCTKEEISKYIVRICKQNLSKVEVQQRQIDQLYERFGIPSSLSFDIITLKTSPEDETDFILFCFVYVLNNKDINKFFTEKEIATYSESKYKVDKIKFPIKYRMIQIAEDQWIGSISVKDLMKLRNAQLINYNENAQRKLKRVVSGEEEWYTIDVNREAVNGIVESYRNDTYIPNTITLNLPETSEFKYDGEYLIINELEAFDILDGYHRYIAMSQIYNTNRKFDYSMELRIVSFPDEKSRQFIWQEDQKTKMNKIDSEALNQNNPANQITQMLSTKGILSGVISRNKGIIDTTSISQLISLLFISKAKKVDRQLVITVRDNLYNMFDEIAAKDPTILNKKWSNEFLASVMLAFSFDCSDLNKIKEFYNVVSSEENKYIFTGRTFTQQTVSRLTKIWKGGF